MRLAMLFDNFGPYHLARLNALRRDCDLVAVQFRSSSSEYRWEVGSSVDVETRTILMREEGSEFLCSRLSNILDDIRPDVVFSPGWDSAGAVGALLWCYRVGVPAIVMSDSQEIDVRRFFVKERVKAALLASASGMLVGGSRHRAYAEKLGMCPQRIRERYDVVDNAYFERKLNSNTSRPFAARYFLACARFLPRKNVLHLIRAYAGHRASMLGKGEPAPELIILGDGTERDVIEAEVLKRGLSAVVHFPGFVQYDRIAPYFIHALAFVHVPVSEQWGLVVNEAMACGLPIIVSAACGCAPDLVEDGVNGFVVDAMDIGALIDRLGLLAEMDENRRREMGVRSREKVAKFSPAAFVESCLELAHIATYPRQGSVSWIDRKILEVFGAFRCWCS